MLLDWGISIRRACKALKFDTSTYHYKSRRTGQAALCRLLDDGRVELDTNTVELAIRPVAIGRKNHLFAGSDGGAERWAIVTSFLATAKLNDIEPYAHLNGVLERITADRRRDLAGRKRKGAINQLFLGL
jgi:Transposase IS66 family/IS66 C-terminal element